jgi:hypothetical protein
MRLCQHDDAPPEHVTTFPARRGRNLENEQRERAPGRLTSRSPGGPLVLSGGIERDHLN